MTLERGERKRRTSRGPVKVNDGILAKLLEPSEESKWKEEFKVSSLNSTTRTLSNPVQSSFRIRWSSTLVKLVHNSPIAKVWSVNYSWEMKENDRR